MAAVALAEDFQPEKLRVGIFAGARLQPRWVAEAFAQVARADCAEIVALGVAAMAPDAAPFLVRTYRSLDQWAFGAERCEPLDLVHELPYGRLLEAPFHELIGLDLDVAFAVGQLDETPLDGVARLGVWRFQVDGALYRPAQVCAPRHGAGIALHRVLRLTPETYAERQVRRLVPPAGGPLIGLHTVNRAGCLTVADALTRRRRI